MIKQAFKEVCTEAKPATHSFVSLYIRVPFYGGPEEGGWWGSNVKLVETQQFPTEEQAQEAMERIEKLTEQLNFDARQADNRAMANSMEWLEERGLEADFLPEPAGPENYFVIVEDSPGSQEHSDDRHYS